MNFLRRFWRNILFIGGGYWAGTALAFLAGTAAVPFMLAGIIIGTAGSVMSERSIREAALRWITGRPHPDYARIAKLERELGMTEEQK